MKIVNLTPHAINLIIGDQQLTVEPSGQVARVSVHIEKIGEIDGEIEGIPITTSVFGEVEGLPEAKANVVYLVSSLVAQRVKERNDVFIPNESVRDSEGRIIGCKSLGRI